MKKFMFSVIAVMAFSVSSMGSTIEFKSLKSNNQNDFALVELQEQNFSVVTFRFLSRCDVIFFGTAALAQQQGFSPADARTIALAAFRACDELGG